MLLSPMPRLTELLLQSSHAFLRVRVEETTHTHSGLLFWVIFSWFQNPPKVQTFSFLKGEFPLDIGFFDKWTIKQSVSLKSESVRVQSLILKGSKVLVRLHMPDATVLQRTSIRHSFCVAEECWNSHGTLSI